MRRPDFTTQAEPDFAAVGLREPSTTSQPADLLDAGRPLVSIDDLVQDYIDSRRKTYIGQGWEKFKAREYRRAADAFSLAISVCIDDPEARAELELARLFAGVASHQYSSAVGSLRWLLTPTRHTGQLPDVDFLTKARQIESRYGDKLDFALHVREVESLAIANAKIVEYQALRSVLLAAKGDTVGAAFYAKSLVSSTPAPWPVLRELLERPTAAQPSALPVATQPAGLSSAAVLTPQTLVTQK